MDIATFTDYCLTKRGAEASLPFDEKTWVCKVGGRIFVLAIIEPFESFSVKCEPLLAQRLRDQYECIKPGYHMNKRHWNTIHLTGELDKAQLLEMIDASYELVFSKLSDKEKKGWGLG